MSAFRSVPSTPDADPDTGTVTASSDPTRELTYVVSGMSCRHCTLSVSEEVGEVSGVEAVDADLETKLVRVRGTHLDDVAIRAAIEAAGYEGVPA